MKAKILFLSMMLAFSFAASAQQHVPARRDPIVVTQPDGTNLTILLHGDEHHSWRTTADGYVIKLNKKEFYCYVKENRKGELVVTRYVAKNADERSARDVKFLEKKGVKK